MKWRPAPEDILLILGLATLAAGLGLIYVPAALIVVGLLLLAAGLLVGRSRGGG